MNPLPPTSKHQNQQRAPITLKIIIRITICPTSNSIYAWTSHRSNRIVLTRRILASRDTMGFERSNVAIGIIWIRSNRVRSDLDVWGSIAGIVRFPANVVDDLPFEDPRDACVEFH